TKASRYVMGDNFPGKRKDREPEARGRDLPESRERSGRRLNRLATGSQRRIILPIAEMTIDGAPRQAIENNTTQKLRIRPLDLLGLGGDIPGEADTDLNGAGLPHRLAS
ncbi:MAG: hypothetical protein R6T96_04945, partial [Longimicrobiales bacterium]